MASKERTRHKERVQRCITQGLRLLGIDETKTVFRVMGSTGTEYAVVLNELNVTCNCADCTRRQRKCKHILFVMSRIMQLNAAELEKMGPRVVLEPNVRDDLIRRASSFVELRAQRPANREADDTCGICLEPFKAVVACVRDCEQCWHTAHAECLKEWHLASRGAPRSCPYCRATDTIGDPHILRVLKTWNAERPADVLRLSASDPNANDITECLFTD